MLGPRWAVLPMLRRLPRRHDPGIERGGDDGAEPEHPGTRDGDRDRGPADAADAHLSPGRRSRALLLHRRRRPAPGPPSLRRGTAGWRQHRRGDRGRRVQPDRLLPSPLGRCTRGPPGPADPDGRRRFAVRLVGRRLSLRHVGPGSGGHAAADGSRRGVVLRRRGRRQPRPGASGTARRGDEPRVALALSRTRRGAVHRGGGYRALGVPGRVARGGRPRRGGGRAFSSAAPDEAGGRGDPRAAPTGAPRRSPAWSC